MGSVELPVVEQGGDEDDEAGAGVVHEGARRGGELLHEREDDRGEVDGHGERYAEADRRCRRIGEALEIGNLHDVITHQCYVGGFDSDVAAHRPHRRADVGGLQGRRVVHAVAAHQDLAPLFLQVLDVRHFFLGQKLRTNLVDADLACK